MSALLPLIRRNLAGAPEGIAAYCTAHEDTLRAVCAAHAGGDDPVLIEATCNQVNQEGGYTGLTPSAFRALVAAIATEAGLDPARLVLGGDHLGPNPWRALPAAAAMERARAMVAAYAAAGFGKLHLDTSMRLGDDPERLEEAVVAARAAELCAVAEAHARLRPLYVIGTEVPVPGGEGEGAVAVRPTAPAAVAETVAQHRRAFTAQGLGEAFGRVIAVVAQPGVDFGNEAVLPFAPEGARGLGDALAALGGVAGEAHSTDYQPEPALRALVGAHFAILKVGPELTAAYRRALLGLAHVEDATIPAGRRSELVTVLLRRMAARPADWQEHYRGDPLTLRRLQLFSNSDRVRYYWPDPEVAEAVRRLLGNLDGRLVPPLLLEQYLPDLAGPPGEPLAPATLARAAVARVVRRYRRATVAAG